MRTSTKDWAVVSIVTGGLGILCYFGSVVFKPFPWTMGRLLFFFIGPLSAASALCFYKALEARAPRIPLLLGCAFTAISGAIVVVMAVVQDMQFTYFSQQIRATSDVAVQQSLERILWGVNVVQSGLDVAWDIFLSLGTALIGLSLFTHPCFGRLLGGLGVAAALSALTLNLVSYPIAPAESGLVDLGPAVGAWYAIVLVRLLMVRDRLEATEQKAPG
jgi:hypothetical protein